MHLAGLGKLLPGPVRVIVASPDIAVAVFIIVSGFVITHLLITKQEPYGPYLARRAMRLAPLYLSMVAAAIILRPLYLQAYTNPFATGGDMRVARIALENASFAEHISLHLVGLHGVVPDTLLPYSSTAFLSPSWSISLEWQFYIVAPLVIGGLASLRWATLVPAAVLAATVIMMGTGLEEQWKYPAFLPLAFPYFLVGIATRMLFEKPLNLLAPGVAAASLIPLAYGTSLRQISVALVIWMVFTLVTAIEVGLIGKERFWAKRAASLISNPVARGIGRVSYSTYLCHIPVFSVALGGALLAGMAPTQANVALTLGAAMVLVLPVSLALFHFVEMPGNAVGRALALRLGDSREQAASLLSVPDASKG